MNLIKVESIKLNITTFNQDLQNSIAQFENTAFTSPEFYEVTRTVFQNIHKMRTELDLQINAEPFIDKTKVRHILFSELVAKPYNNLINEQSLLKILNGILNNENWTNDVCKLSLPHSVGFWKLGILNEGGINVTLPKDESDNLAYKSINVPDLELRLHVFDPGSKNKDFLDMKNMTDASEYPHKHGFDLISKLGFQAFAVDQRYSLTSTGINKETLKRMDRLGIDIPCFTSEAQNLKALKNRLGVDSAPFFVTDAMAQKIKEVNTNRGEKVIKARQTYKYYGDKELGPDKKSDVAGKKGKRYTMYQPQDEFQMIPQKAISCIGASTRLHPSEEPHYFMAGKGSYTTCLMLRRMNPHKGEKFCPSFFLLNDKENSEFLKLEKGFDTSIKKAMPIPTHEQLHTSINTFIVDLKNDINIKALINNDPRKLAEYQLGALVDKLLFYSTYFSKVDTLNRTDSAEVLRLIRTIMASLESYKSSQAFLMTNTESTMKPSVFIPVYCMNLVKEIQQQLVQMQSHSMSNEKPSFELLFDCYQTFNKCMESGKANI